MCWGRAGGRALPLIRSCAARVRAAARRLPQKPTCAPVLQTGLGAQLARLYEGHGFSPAEKAELLPLVAQLAPPAGDERWEVSGPGGAGPGGAGFLQCAACAASRSQRAESVQPRVCRLCRLCSEPTAAARAQATHRPARRPGPQDKPHQHLTFNQLLAASREEWGRPLLRKAYSWLKARGLANIFTVTSAELVARCGNPHPFHFDKATGALAYQQVRGRPRFGGRRAAGQGQHAGVPAPAKAPRRQPRPASSSSAHPFRT